VPIKIGVNLWTVYGWNVPEPILPEVLRAVGGTGVAGVELVLDESANTADALLGRRAELQAALASAELEVPSVATTLFWRYNLASQDPQVRRRALGIVRDGCRLARGYGARVFLVVAGVQEHNTEYARTYDTAVETFQEAARLADGDGVILGIENVPSSFLSTPREYAQFLADVDRPAVRAYLDPANGAALGNGYPENWVTAVRGRIAMAHAKDYDRRLRVHVPCGQGELGWDAIVATLRSVGYDDYLMIETPPMGGQGRFGVEAGIAAAETSAKWLRRYV
jgi:L-ribulose-5-phosphate 3-epimerase